MNASTQETLNALPGDAARAVDGPETDSRGKALAAVLSLAMIGAVLWPLQQNWRADPRDSFPLSYYPMFSARREANETFWYVVGRDEQGGRHYVPYRMIGSGGGNQVRRQLRKIVNSGRAPELAHTVARRMARQDREPWSKIVRVEVCKGTFAVNEFFHGHKDPLEEQIKGTGEVRRKEP